jgi:hypothetical protein
MAHWKVGNKGEARKCYDRAVQWMEKSQPNNVELRRFRAEAEELLKIGRRPVRGRMAAPRLVFPHPRRPSLLYSAECPM